MLLFHFSSKVLLNKEIIALNQDPLGYAGRRIGYYESSECKQVCNFLKLSLILLKIQMIVRKNQSLLKSDLLLECLPDLVKGSQRWI